MPARDIAFKVLLDVERADAFLNVALDTALRSEGVLPRQESGLATELAYGVARRRLTLDAALQAHADRPLEKLETMVHVALRLGAYQLLFLDRVPAHAAVGETVNLMKKNGLTRASGFVNAILRKISQDKEIPLPEEPLSRLSVQESHPRWLVARWAKRFGLEEASALCAADNVQAKVTARVNLTRASRDEVIAQLATAGVVGTPSALSPLGLTLEDAGAIAALEPFRSGLFQIQDEAAQLVSLMTGVKPGMRILDACAAPGGKTCHLAEQLQGHGEIVAVDLHERKLERLREESKRLGVDERIKTLAADAGEKLPYLDEASFDLILLDAPCSGLGTLRRHPELRYRREESDVARLAELQRGLAKNVMRYLKKGGTLTFAVCSPEPEEGELQIAALESLGLRHLPPALPEEILSRVRAPKGGIATFPHRHGTDGFFAARFTLP